MQDLLGQKKNLEKVKSEGNLFIEKNPNKTVTTTQKKNELI